MINLTNIERIELDLLLSKIIEKGCSSKNKLRIKQFERLKNIRFKLNIAELNEILDTVGYKKDIYDNED